MSQPIIKVVPDVDALAREGARRFVEIARAQIAERGRFTVALSGGSTPRPMYRLLTKSPQRDAVDWSRVFVFWADERTVPPDHEQSNYRMARETLLDHVPIPRNQIFRMQGENDPTRAAEEYERVLVRVFALEPGEPPDFGLIILGIGADGHTASLFPATEALDETDRLVVANSVPQLDTVRITLTIPVLTRAANTLVLASGEDKAAAVQRALEGPYDPVQTPSQVLRTATGTVIWLLDEAAASQLQTVPRT